MDNAGREIGRSRQLWASLPRELADQFRPHAEGMAKEIITAIQEAVPIYAQPLQGAFGEVFTQGIEQSLLQNLDNLGTGKAPMNHWISLYRHLGKVEFSEGRTLDHLQTAYRVGGRVAWRYVSKVGQSLCLDSDIFCTAAEAIFAYVDEISALSIEGYTIAKARAAGAIARRRRRLLDLLLTEPPASPQAISGLAAEARWKVPEQVTAVALEPRPDQHEMVLPEFDGDVLTDLEGAEPCLLIPGTVEDVAGLAKVLDGWRAVVGLEVPLTTASESLRWARRTLRLVRDGVLPAEPVTRCADHLSKLWLLTDDFLLRQLGDRCLAPLEGLTVKQRARLSETLLAWLQSRGGAPEIAEMLKVHPQTVRYRLHQLEALFGERLHNVNDRLHMEIALRARKLTGKLG
ncbi:helix-turn-helix domain-containing protein [Amycolatopsis nigrescens]|uniref:PucR family transcriptional regulator n=1 Tax=Amycolatopsis nigrescens TaxID=381445 RepID=UPI00037E21C8|nr:PucR family transcriptional regulator [Amycolatopsis nigrescens]